MKKCFSLLLTLAMLLSMVPSVGAVASEPVENEEPRIAMERPVRKEINDLQLDAEMQSDLARREANAKRLESLSLDEIIDMPAADALNASTAKVTVNVTFPKAAAQSDTVRAYLYVPGEVDENGLVTSYPSSWYSQSKQLQEGEKSVSFTFNSVQSGKYFVGVYSYAAGTGSYLYDEVYFNADGTVASNEYTATPMTISSTKTINLTMPKAERTVSGTVKFSEPLEEDTWFEINLQAYNSYDGAYAYYELEAEQGSTSFDFDLGVPADIYRMRIYSNNSGYADLYGTISSDDSAYRMYLNLSAESATGLVIDGDPLLGEDESVDTPNTRVTFSAKLPEALSTWNEYALLLYNEDGSLSTYSWLNADQGDTVTDTRSFGFPKGKTFKVAYAEAKNGEIDWSNEATAPRFLGDDGITSDFENAKLFTVGDTDMEITIDDSSCYILSGTLKLDNPCHLNYLACYVVAEFENDEVFGSRVDFWKGDESAEYKLYIPKTMRGSFSLGAARAADGRYLNIDEETFIDGGTSKVTASSLPTITLPIPETNVTGIFTLPDGMVAPKGGLAVELGIDYASNDVYMIPAGESSFTFSAAAEIPEDEDSLYIWAYVLNAPDNLADEVYGYYDLDALTDIEMLLPETVVITATFEVPEDCREMGSTIEISSYGDLEDPDTGETIISYNNWNYVTILPGKTEVTFAIKALKDARNQLLAEVYTDATGMLLTSDLYMAEDGTFSTDYENFTPTEDMTAYHMYGKGKLITGTITAPVSGEYRGTVTAYNTSNHEDYQGPSFRFNGTSGTYTVAVPMDDEEAEYYVYLDLYDGPDEALTDTPLYWSEQGTVLSEVSEDRFTIPTDGIVRDFTIPKAKVVSGSVLLEEGLPENGFYYGNVYVHDSEGNRFSGYFNSNNDFGMNYTVKLPVTDEQLSYIISVRCSQNGNTPSEIVPYTHFYLTEDGSMSADESKAKSFTIGSDGLVQDVTIPKGKTFTVTLNAPDGCSGYYSGRVYMYNLDTYSNGNTVDFSFTDSGEVTFTVPAGASSNSTLRLRVDEGPGAITGRYYYYADGNWVQNTDDAKPIDTSTGAASVSLPAAKVVTLDINVPEGCSGTYRGSVQLEGPIYQSSEFEFTSENGSGTSVSFTVPDDSSAQYRLQIYLNEGSGVMINRYYYYTADGTWSTNSDNYITLENLPTSITMPASKEVTIAISAPEGFSGVYRGRVELNGSSYHPSRFEFTSTNGSGGSVTFTLPDDTTSTYCLSVYVSEGTGVLKSTRYYTSSGTWADSYDAAYLTLAQLPTSITLPAAKTLSGKLVSSDGSAIKLDGESRGSLSLMSAYNCSYNIDAEGNFVISMPDSNDDSYYLRYSPYQTTGNNIVTGDYYYYKADSTESYHDRWSSDEIDMSKGSVSGIELVVDTGYLLSGSITIADDVTFTISDEDYDDPSYPIGSVAVQLSYQEDDESYPTIYRTSVYFNSVDKTYSYTMVVPKNAQAYDFIVGPVDLGYYVTSNVYSGALTLDTITPTADMTLPTATLNKYIATITGTFSFPNYGSDGVSTTLHVVVGENEYQSYDYIYTGESISVQIPSSEFGTEYKLYYTLESMSGNMFISDTAIYVAADGSLTMDPAQAGTFTVGNNSHSITPMEQPPYLSGKIYLPDDLDDEDGFTLRLRTWHSSDIYINSDTIKTDIDGRKYVEYAMRDPEATPGTEYLFRYQISDYSGSILYNPGPGDYIYLDENYHHVSNSSYAYRFILPENGAVVLDFDLPTWQTGAEDNVFQSAHGISSQDGTLTYTYTYPDPNGVVESLSVVYSPLTTHAYYTVNGQTDTYLYGGMTATYTGNSLTISVTPSYSTPIYGFAITSITPNFKSGSSLTEATVTAVYTEAGTTDAQVMQSVANGSAVYTSIIAPKGTSGIVIAATYDANGKMLESVIESVTFANENAPSSDIVFGNVSLDFDSSEDASKLQIMLIDSTTGLIPKMVSKVITG